MPLTEQKTDTVQNADEKFAEIINYLYRLLRTNPSWQSQRDAEEKVRQLFHVMSNERKIEFIKQFARLLFNEHCSVPCIGILSQAMFESLESKEKMTVIEDLLSYLDRL